MMKHITLQALGTNHSVCDMQSSAESLLGEIASLGTAKDIEKNVTEAVSLRGEYGGITYIWSLDKEASLKKYFDLGVLGILTNNPSRLAGILKEPRYAAKFRRATPSEPFPLPSSR